MNSQTSQNAIRNALRWTLSRVLPGVFAVALGLVSASCAAIQAGRPPRPARHRAQREAQPAAGPASGPASRPAAQPAAPEQRESAGSGQSALHGEQPVAAVAQQAGPPPAPQRQAPINAAPARPATVPVRPGEAPHLAEWMEAHRNLPLAEQHRALENERGFRSQTPEEQERLHQRLTQLNAMPPGQRQQLIQRTEALERLTPQQRRQYTSTAAQLGNMPENRQHAVVQAFHNAREMPEPQRQAWLNSQQVRNRFSDQERETLNNLLSLQPAAAQAGLPGFAPR